MTNSVRHSGSAVGGGLVTVSVAAGEGGVRVEVTDRSGGGIPVLLPAAFADVAQEGGRGMGLVDACAARWGCWRTRRVPGGSDQVFAAAASPVAAGPAASARYWSPCATEEKANDSAISAVSPPVTA